MSKLTRAGILFAASISMVTPVLGGSIERACLTSDRGSGQRALCTCIQGAADRTLNRRDQRLAATFFDEPDEAQRVRQSDSRRLEAFWERYKSFGKVAKKTCSELP